MENRVWKNLCDQAFADGRFVCMGIDPPYDQRWKTASDVLKNDIMTELFQVCWSKVRGVAHVVGFIKPNWAFFVQYGWRGLKVLEKLVADVHQEFPHIAVIVDMKVGDIGDTNRAYVQTAFEELQGDAITIHPYLGLSANLPFVERSDKGIFVLCHTSNQGADEFQHISVAGQKLYIKVAQNVDALWNTNKNCGLVTGATFPDAITNARSHAPTLPFLVPGIGKQGGDLKAAVKAAMRSDGAGFIINASSSIFGVQDSGRAAKDLHEAILSAMK